MLHLLGVLIGVEVAKDLKPLLALFLDLDNQLGGDTLCAPLGLFVNCLARAVGEDRDDSTVAFGSLAQLVGS